MARRSPSRTKAASSVAGTATLATVGDWLRFAVTAFTDAPLAFAQGLHGPREEAMFLLGRFLGLEQDDLPHFLAARLTPREIQALRALIRRRIEDRVPVPYLVREAWLGGLRFYVDERVLIPRSYIAALLPDAVAAFAGSSWSPERILDLGTGSGCLAILAARAFPGAVVDAVDVSADALAVAADNVAGLGCEGRVRLLQSDLFTALPSSRYDLIIANPPYEPAALVDDQPPELDHEPRLALDGGHDGLALVRRIVAEARDHLAPDGILVLELGGLRLELLAEFPALKPHIFTLPDGTDAVLGLRTRDLPQTSPPGPKLRPRR